MSLMMLLLCKQGTDMLSALALATESPASIFGVYLVVSLGVMASVCVFPSPTWVHHAFKVVVYWTVSMAIVWFGAKLSRKSK